MKKILLMMVLTTLVLTGCKKDEDEKSKFNYDINMLYGTWDITDVYNQGKWVDITKPGFESMAASASFKSNGTYEGKGYFGNGTGTYSAVGNTITCYVADKEYAKYDVTSLTSKICELNMTMGKESVKIKCKKR